MAINEIRTRYQTYAKNIFPMIEPILSAHAGIPISLCAINEAELLESERWREHPECRALWTWRTIVRKFLRTPKRMDVSFYCEGLLCGLMIATISRARVNVNVVYVEASPDPTHPLKHIFLEVALFQAELFAASLNATHVSVSNPVQGVVDHYLRLGYKRIAADRKRLLRGQKPRDKLLVKPVGSTLHFDQASELA